MFQAPNFRAWLARFDDVQDLKARGMGLRSQRYVMVVDGGIVTLLNVEAPAKFEVSDAETILNSL